VTGLLLRARGGVPFGKVIAQCHPLSVVGNLVKQPNLIRRQSGLNGRSRVRALLLSPPAKQKRRVALIGRGRVKFLWTGSHGWADMRKSGGNAFAGKSDAVFTPAFAK